MKGTTRLRAKLETLDVERLRIESGCSVQTIRKWAKGDPVRDATAKRLSRAAAKLAIEVYA